MIRSRRFSPCLTSIGNPEMFSKIKNSQNHKTYQLQTRQDCWKWLTSVALSSVNVVEVSHKTTKHAMISMGFISEYRHNVDIYWHCKNPTFFSLNPLMFTSRTVKCPMGYWKIRSVGLWSFKKSQFMQITNDKQELERWEVWSPAKEGSWTSQALSTTEFANSRTWFPPFRPVPLSRVTSGC